MFKKILVAEDNLMNCKLVLLGLKQYDVDVAYDGQEAVDLFTRNNYDVILMDLQMPIKSGIEATEEIRKFESETYRMPRTFILGMTADWIPSVEDACKAAGIDDFLPKPFLPSEITRLIEEKYARAQENQLYQS
jgi:CheY-like chemotaxis protein